MSPPASLHREPYASNRGEIHALRTVCGAQGSFYEFNASLLIKAITLVIPSPRAIQWAVAQPCTKIPRRRRLREYGEAT